MLTERKPSTDNDICIIQFEAMQASESNGVATIAAQSNALQWKPDASAVRLEALQANVSQTSARHCSERARRCSGMIRAEGGRRGRGRGTAQGGKESDGGRRVRKGGVEGARQTMMRITQKASTNHHHAWPGRLRPPGRGQEGLREVTFEAPIPTIRKVCPTST